MIQRLMHYSFGIELTQLEGFAHQMVIYFDIGAHFCMHKNMVFFTHPQFRFLQIFQIWKTLL